MAYVFRTKDKSGKVHPRWRFQFTDWRGRRRTGTGTTSKGETIKLAVHVQTNEDAIRRKWRNAPKTSDKPRALASVVGEYLEWGQAQGGRGGRPWAATHLRVKKQRLAFWQSRFQGALIQEITLPKAEAMLREIAQTGLPGRHWEAKALAGKTLKCYASELHSLVLWAKTRGYLEADPLEGMADFDTTPQTRRRALSLGEIQDILGKAEDQDERLVFETALCSGLRAGELRALTVGHLDAVRGGLCLEAAWTKNRHPGFQVLPDELLARLAASAAGKDKSAPLLNVRRRLLEGLYAAMKRAGVSKFIPGEGKVDFHALRVAYTTLVIESGATVKEAQSLVRHSTPGLTMNTYARARNERLKEIAEKVGGAVLRPSGSTTEAQRKAAGAESLRLSNGYVVGEAGLEPA